jgi:HSP20 family protein
MPTVIRKIRETTIESRRDMLHAVSWQVRSTLWCPPTDVYETEEAHIIRMEIAGMREEDFDISIQNNTIMISGSRPHPQEKFAYHQMEIQSGKFTNIIELRSSIDVENANAEYKDGFLTITLPKAKPNHIKVK